MAKNKEGKLPVVDENGDYIWRFKLDAGKNRRVIKDNTFAELFRSQLDEMLKVVVLTREGKKVRVDGFYLINEPDRVYPIWDGDENP
ncbi:MAG: hypothetical protein JW954_07910 [Dehalococcoidaceae bacterium]|nr:hypothetical protein [Dehalococcoidaceae bacterium]